MVCHADNSGTDKCHYGMWSTKHSGHSEHVHLIDIITSIEVRMTLCDTESRPAEAVGQVGHLPYQLLGR